MSVNIPNPGHETWLGAFWRYLKFVVSFVTGRLSMYQADVVTTTNLGYTYANGTLGVGATLTGGSNGAFPTTEGVVPFDNMLVLVAGETTKANNGLYVLHPVGDANTKAVLTKTTDFDASAKIINGTLFGIRLGSTNGGKVWAYTGASTPTVGTDDQTFAADSVVRSAIAAVISAVQQFAQDALQVLNSGGTFYTKMRSAASANRTFTFPDADATAAQAGVNTGSTTPGVTGATAPAFTGTAYNVGREVRISAPPTQEANAAAATVVANANATASTPMTLGTQPKYPCKLLVYVTDANSSLVGTLTLVGTDQDGNPVTDVLTLTGQGTHTYTTANAYAHLTSATPSLSGIDAGTDKIAVAQSGAIGLPTGAGAGGTGIAAFAVTKENVDTVDEAVGTVDATARTITPTTAANATHNYDFWYSWSVTPAGTVASHTHTSAAHTHVQT